MSDDRDYNRILLTGAGSGIGRACAELLAARGKSLALTGLNPEKLDRVASGVQASRLWARPADITQPAAVRELFDGAAAELGGIDAVIHCAGVGLIRPLEEVAGPEFLQVMNVNVRGCFHVLKEACRIMAPAKKGRFVTIPGILGVRPMKGATVYCASKYAVTGMIQAAAEEYRRHQLQFSLYHFGGVDTPFWDSIEMRVDRTQMIPVEVAARRICDDLDLPSHLVPGQTILQPASHQL
jgi:NAD(P)-dependent dehydrogenase (short-subunit alcohol dehydrogenase family)